MYVIAISHFPPEADPPPAGECGAFGLSATPPWADHLPMRPREESDLDLRLRSAKLYPLSYEGKLSGLRNPQRSGTLYPMKKRRAIHRRSL